MLEAGNSGLGGAPCSPERSRSRGWSLGPGLAGWQVKREQERRGEGEKDSETERDPLGLKTHEGEGRWCLGRRVDRIMRTRCPEESREPESRRKAARSNCGDGHSGSSREQIQEEACCVNVAVERRREGL